MKQTLGSRSLSEFLLTRGAGLLARNSGTAELSQASTYLSYGVLAGIPRPVESGQRNSEDLRGQESQQHMRYAQEQRPAAHALARTALIVSQPQLLDFLEVDFKLATPRIGTDRRQRSEGEVGTQQIPGSEDEPGDGNHQQTGRQRP